MEKIVTYSDPGINCPNCNNKGWFIYMDSQNEPCLEQCEWCYRTPNSKHNFIFYPMFPMKVIRQ